MHPVTESGYHPIKSIFLRAEGKLHDTIEVFPSNQTSVKVLQSPIKQSENIVFKAIQALQKNGINLPHQKIIIDKKIPMGGGLGGGSSNAGNFLKKFGNNSSSIHEIAFQLGADVPFFLQESACMVSGFGEKIIPIDNTLCIPAIIVTFRQNCSTGCIFKLYDTIAKKSWKFDYTKAIELLINSDPKLLDYLQNDLYDTVCQLYPELGSRYLELERLLSGHSFYYSMSGSGSSFFALFEDQERRDTTFTKITKNGFKAYQTLIKSNKN